MATKGTRLDLVDALLTPEPALLNQTATRSSLPSQPRLHREHEETSGGVLAPPLLGGDQLLELGGSDLESGPLKLGGCLGSLVTYGLRHPIHGLGLMVEHGE